MITDLGGNPGGGLGGGGGGCVYWNLCAGSGENGGIGVEIDITGTNIFYAGGGGAGRISTSSQGIGGSEIGGDGKRNTSAGGTLYIPTRLNGVDGTGSGGGGGGYNYNYASGPNGDGGGAGGTGIVIIRYLVQTVSQTIIKSYSDNKVEKVLENKGGTNITWNLTTKEFDCDLITTDDLTEGTDNLYYSETLFDTSLASKNIVITKIYSSNIS